MNGISLSDFPLHIQRVFVEYDRAMFQKCVDSILANVFDEDEDEDEDDDLEKGKKGLLIGTHGVWYGQGYKGGKRPCMGKVDFSKYSDEVLKRFAQKTAETKLARFIDHPAKSANGTPVSDIVKEELAKRAIKKQIVKELQEKAVNEYQKKSGNGKA